MGIDLDDNISSKLTLVYNALTSKFNIPFFNIEFIEFSLRLNTRISTDHYNLINEIFYSNTNMSKLFSQNHITGNNINIRGMINANSVAVIEVESEQAHTEILSKFSDQFYQQVVQ